MKPFGSSLLRSAATGALLLVATSLSAQAADFPTIQPTLHDWTGPYIGAIVGVGGYDTSGAFDTDDDSDSAVNLGALGDVGVFGGGTIGWNLQSGNVVFGIEGDISASSLKRNAEDVDFDRGEQINFDSDYFATIRGRVGLADNDVLLYATGGVAFLRASLGNRDVSGEQSLTVDSVGGVVGAGMEWAVSQNLGVKIEGLYAFMDKTIDLDGRLNRGNNGETFELNDVVTTRIGVNWHFNGKANLGTYETDESVHDWSGPYVGGTLGGAAWTTFGYYDQGDSDSVIDLGAFSSTGVLGGGTLGWNIRTADNMLWGIEGDVSIVDWSAKSTHHEDPKVLEFDADLLATMRGRVGVIDGDLLFYGTGGFAWLVGTLDDVGSGDTDDSLDVLATGMVLGAGMEWAASESMSVKVEGLYVNFNDTKSVSSLSGATTGDAFKVEDAAIARVGANWNFK